MHSPDHSTKGTPSALSLRAGWLAPARPPDSGLWLLVRTRFQGLFHPPCGVLFTFPSRYWFTIGRSKSLALESGLPSFPQGYTCLVVLRIPTGLAPSSSTGLSPALVRRSSRFEWQS